MKLGFVGLGRMGENMCLNLLEHKHKLVVNDLSKTQIKKLARRGATPAYSIEEVVEKLSSPRIIWLMIPAGAPIDKTIEKIVPNLEKGDIIIDGGNSYFKDSIKRHDSLKKCGIRYLDCGTSGGISGARNGACMMVGGDKNTFKKVEKLFKDMCVKDGYGYMGESGAGHFVKMVHNGIEYGMMGALAEGMNAIKKSKFNTNLKEVAKVYDNGSIIKSRLTCWTLEGMNQPNFSKISGSVPKGETEEEMENLEKLAPMKVLEAARKLRVKSRKSPSLIGKLIAVMRNEFGGHKVKKK